MGVVARVVDAWRPEDDAIAAGRLVARALACVHLCQIWPVSEAALGAMAVEAVRALVACPACCQALIQHAWSFARLRSAQIRTPPPSSVGTGSGSTHLHRTIRFPPLAGHAQ